MRHEIDLVVTVEHDLPYEFTYIFECKNWSTPVGPKEIVDFAEKNRIPASSAKRYVANSSFSHKWGGQRFPMP